MVAARIQRPQAFEHAAVCGAEEPATVEPETVWPLRRNGERVSDLRLFAVDHDDLRRLADVRVNAVALLVVERPARPPWQRQLGDHLHRGEVDDAGGAVLAEQFTQLEGVQPAATTIVGEPVRMRPDSDLSEQPLVGAAEHAHAGGGP